MAFELPPLPYDYKALDTAIDEQTMHLHHDKHHAAYVNNLNAALEKHADWMKKSPEQILRHINEVPSDVQGAVRNNGGGHVNHSMFWKIMAQGGGGEPTGNVGKAISQAFGNFEDFKKKFNDTGVKQFGSGWVWLVRQPSGGVDI